MLLVRGEIHRIKRVGWIPRTLVTCHFQHWRRLRPIKRIRNSKVLEVLEVFENDFRGDACDMNTENISAFAIYKQIGLHHHANGLIISSSFFRLSWRSSQGLDLWSGTNNQEFQILQEDSLVIGVPSNYIKSFLGRSLTRKFLQRMAQFSYEKKHTS